MLFMTFILFDFSNDDLNEGDECISVKYFYNHYAKNHFSLG